MADKRAFLHSPDGYLAMSVIMGKKPVVNKATASKTKQILDDAYDVGSPLVADKDYDVVMEYFGESLGESWYTPNSNKETIIIPYPITSCDKVSDMGELRKKYHKYRSEEFIIMPKFDGVGILRNPGGKSAFTKYSYGATMYEARNASKLFQDHPAGDHWIRGEMVMREKIFESNFLGDRKNTRNTVAGAIARGDTHHPEFQMSEMVYFFITSDSSHTVEEQVELLNEQYNKSLKLPHMKVSSLDKITDEFMISLHSEWQEELDVALDGLVVYVNNYHQYNMEAFVEKNPPWALAYKHESFDPKAVVKIYRQYNRVGSDGKLIPMADIVSLDGSPVQLGGVTVSKAYMDSSKWVEDNKAFTGSHVVISRHGNVITRIDEVVYTPEDAQADTKCPCGYEATSWRGKDGSKVYRVCDNMSSPLIECDKEVVKYVNRFFERLGADGLRETTIQNMYDGGVTSLIEFLSVEVSTLSVIDGFGVSSANKLVQSIKNSTTNVPLHKLMHASGMFRSANSSLGSKKLIDLQKFIDFDTERLPTVFDITLIDGFAEKSAETFINGLPKFYRWMDEHGDKLTYFVQEKLDSVEGSLSGVRVAFTGIRLKSLMERASGMGAVEANTVNGKTTHLVCRDPSANSKKIEKAKELGVKVISVDEFTQMVE